MRRERFDAVERRGNAVEQRAQTRALFWDLNPSRIPGAGANTSKSFLLSG